MANLGFQTAYHLFNSIGGCACERAFLPDEGALKEHLRTGTRLFSLESQRPLESFDMLAFSLPFEEDYINIPKLLGLAGIPVSSHERAEGMPLVIAGGVAPSLNPEPLAEIIDLFIVGEGEGAIEEFFSLYRDVKSREYLTAKNEILKALDSLQFAYVPSLYEFTYDGPAIKDIKVKSRAKKKVTASKNSDLERFPVPRSFIRTPYAEFKGALLAEVERGCPRGCRFCAAGFLYLPPRWRGPDKVKEAIGPVFHEGGKAGIVGAAVSEYPWIKALLKDGIESGSIMTLSSLRLDMLDAPFLRLLKDAGLRTVTVAPEAGTERMRLVVNKAFRDEDILDAVRLAADAGFTRMKLYFMLGLPTETDEDAEAIAWLCLRIKSIMKKGALTLSINQFIPKPCTPFQWEALADTEDLNKRLALIKKELSGKGRLTVDAMPSMSAVLQAYLSRADRRASAFITDASAKGIRRALRENAEFLSASVYRERAKDEPLPWDMIDHGVKKQYLWKEYQKGLNAEPTEPCHVGSCFRCGVCVRG
ncbi:MAG: radical SAM protein [Deltaproteobacteria bacterium]|nr:radical SAM protein [Deltaproteobacteria bacterium]